MKGIKIKPIKTLNDVKGAFAFFKKSYLTLTESAATFSLPLHETYEGMVDNLERKEKLQFFAMLNDEVIACLIAFPSNETENALYVPVLAVESQYRSSGIASRMLSELQKSIAGTRYNLLRIPALEDDASFFIKRGFELRLGVKTYPPHTVQHILDSNLANLEPVEEVKGKIKVRFAVPSFDEKLIMPFIRKLQNVKIEYIFEKKI